MPTVLRWGPYRAFFYSNEGGANRRIFTFERAISKPNSGCTTSRSRPMRDFLPTKSETIIRHLRSQRDLLEGKWHEHFGN